MVLPPSSLPLVLELTPVAPPVGEGGDGLVFFSDGGTWSVFIIVANESGSSW